MDYSNICPVCSYILYTEVSMSRTLIKQCISCELNHYGIPCSCKYEYKNVIITTCESCIMMSASKIDNSDMVLGIDYQAKLELLNITQLRDIARKKQLTGFSILNKSSLILMLLPHVIRSDFM